jgi:hypothetical protein
MRKPYASKCEQGKTKIDDFGGVFVAFVDRRQTLI